MKYPDAEKTWDLTPIASDGTRDTHTVRTTSSSSVVRVAEVVPDSEQRPLGLTSCLGTEVGVSRGGYETHEL